MRIPIVLVAISLVVLVSLNAQAELSQQSVGGADRVASYVRARPQLGVQLGFAPVSQASGGKAHRAFALGLEYQPRFLQRYGVLGVGPIAAMHLGAIVGDSPEYINWSERAYSWGLRLHYQLRLWEGQILVPGVSYQLQKWQSVGPSKYGAILSGYGLSGMFLLNALDTSIARGSFASIGLSRTYLAFEYQRTQSITPGLELSMSSYVLGLRLEFL